MTVARRPRAQCDNRQNWAMRKVTWSILLAMALMLLAAAEAGGGTDPRLWLAWYRGTDEQQTTLMGWTIGATDGLSFMGGTLACGESPGISVGQFMAEVARILRREEDLKPMWAVAVVYAERTGCDAAFLDAMAKRGR